MGAKSSKDTKPNQERTTEQITQECEKELEKLFDVDFNQEAMLGVDWVSGYAEMSEPKHATLKNEAFYFMYKSENTTNPKVLVTCIGGPGCAVMMKAFGRYNPLSVNGETMCLEKNEKSITDEYHLLYIECPVGAGFSVCHNETKVNDFATLGKNAVELFEKIFEENPTLKEAEFFFDGESFSGLSIPTVINHLRTELDINFKGAVLECHVMKNGQQCNLNYHKELITEQKLWDNCCHKCTCSCALGFVTCLNRCKCISQDTSQDLSFLPFMCPTNPWIKKKQVEGKKEPVEFTKVMPINLTIRSKEFDINMEESICPQDILKQVTSKKFSETIGAKKTAKFQDDEFMNVMSDSSHATNAIISGWLKEGKKVWVLSGDGDYIVPWKSMYDQLEKNWEFEGKDDFLKQKWEKHTETGDGVTDEVTYYHKKSSKSQLEWRRVVKGGHMIVFDSPDLHCEMIKEFLDEAF